MKMVLPNYVSLGDTSSQTSSTRSRDVWTWPLLFTIAVASLTPILIPFIHFGVLSHLWDKYNFNVDTKRCSCSCWDTIFKGPYERGPAGYKNIYFNITSNTMKIWIVTVAAVLLLYEAFKKLLTLLFKGQVRWSMLVLLLVGIYPNYYSWWSYFNYWNDDFYSQWNHQAFFSSTELASTLMVVHLLDRRVTISSRKCLLISAIATLHILSSGFDQFVDNVLRGNGMMHQVLRDVFFMLPDLLNVTLPLLEVRAMARDQRLPSMAHAISSKEFVATVVFIALGWVICYII